VSTPLEKVRKLLALAASTSPHEAAAATAQAQAILHKYRLSQADLEAGEPPEYANELLYKGREETWTVDLACAIGEPNGVFVWDRPTGGGRHECYLFGREQDVAHVKALWQWVSAELRRLAARDCAGESPRYRREYLLGAAIGVAKQLRKTQAKAKMTSALVRTDDAVKSAFDGIVDHRKTATWGDKEDGAADAGIKVGAGLHLGKRLAAPEAKRLRAG
jgi:hypothetical protein